MTKDMRFLRKERFFCWNNIENMTWMFTCLRRCLNGSFSSVSVYEEVTAYSRPVFVAALVSNNEYIDVSSYRYLWLAMKIRKNILASSSSLVQSNVVAADAGWRRSLAEKVFWINVFAEFLACSFHKFPTS
ncbi:hypothetical protein L484_003810 [Morus notabilis]|uniref:Uncharacterized protein n=1 Tax=Morus notabilis TaxID=981085 RepID=W9S3R6_9ROSA|nr:hypothetical protein L484_003810 [Morus notabilis]